VEAVPGPVTVFYNFRFAHPRVIEGSRTEGRGHDAVRGRIKGVGSLRYQVLTEVPKGPGARVLATERASQTGEVKSTSKSTDGAARGLTLCTNSWSPSTPPQNAFAEGVEAEGSPTASPAHRLQDLPRGAPERPSERTGRRPGKDGRASHGGGHAGAGDRMDTGASGSAWIAELLTNPLDRPHLSPATVPWNLLPTSCGRWAVSWR
jgi:hypothetical protein